jgi:hypothetical protein
LALAVHRLRGYCREARLSPGETLEKALTTVVGLDLNPLAVLAARANLLLTLGDLLPHRRDAVTLPVFLADSILGTCLETDPHSQAVFGEMLSRPFERVVGNPPWVNWESLPEDYRRATRPLWEHYGLFPHRGMDTILGKSKKDLAMLMTYVAADSYLARQGRLGFVITQSVFKTAGAGQGFRRFWLDKENPLRVIGVEDLGDLTPFRGAANRTALLIIEKGNGPTRYPAPYVLWRKNAQVRNNPADDSSLANVIAQTVRVRWIAEPVDPADPTSSWLTGLPQIVQTVRKVTGPSDYQAREGVNTGGANGVYWLEVVERRPDGLLVVKNLTERAKRPVASVRALLETDLVYPLLRGRDVARWSASPQAHILLVQDPERRRGIDETRLATTSPRTYAYLRRFESVLRQRSVYKRFFDQREPFYSMFGVGPYTLAPYKVVWRYIAAEMTAAVVEPEPTGDKATIPDHRLMLVPLTDLDEAYYLAAVLNSAIGRVIVGSFTIGTQISTHVLGKLAIPRCQAADPVHRQLAELSRQAHAATAAGRSAAAIEAEIDQAAARLWGLSQAELAQVFGEFSDPPLPPHAIYG